MLAHAYSPVFEKLLVKGEEGIPELAELILAVAGEVGASDVHVEARRDCYSVRYRKDGFLVPLLSIPRALGQNLIARFKMQARVLTYRTRAPQDGRVEGTEGIGIRAAFMPTLHGEKAVLRLPASGAPQYLEQLGMEEQEQSRFQQVLLGGHGVVFFTGPSSSGKSTTIYAALRHILSHALAQPNIVTLEDPIEQEIPGVNQTQIDPVGGLTFLTGLRTILRMDTDVIVVGEIRDDETARIAIHAGLSGHRVLTTIHSGTAAQVYARLLHMGIEPFLLASAVSAVVAQRLARLVCQKCATLRQLSEAEKSLLVGDDAPETQGLTAQGCRDCLYTGVKGRMALFEVGIPNASLREALLSRAPTSEISLHLVRGGMRPLRQAIGQAFLNQKLSIEEGLRLLGGVTENETF